MAILPAHTDFTDKDFDALRLCLTNFVRTVFPDWTDFNVANFGNILLELFAFTGEVLTFYQDNQARESRIITATQRKNVIALAKLLGFTLTGARAATADVVFKLAAPPAADATLPTSTIVRTQEVTEPVRFQLLTPVTIPTGANPPTAVGTVENSEPQEEFFEATGLALQEVKLTFAPYLDDSVQVTAGNGTYESKSSLLNSGPSDLHYVVGVDQNDRATLRFGDGLQGVVPKGTIKIGYKTGGGPDGNVDADRIVVIEGASTDAFGNPIQVSVTNPQSASGGAPRQSIAAAKVLAPASLRTLNRTVSREDFENNALRLTQVARALMLTSNEDTTIGENSGILFVIPQGGGIPSQALKDQVLHQVTVVFPATLTFSVAVQAPVYQTVNIEARVFLSAGANTEAARADIQKTLEDFFKVILPNGTPNPSVDFGFNVKNAEGLPEGEVAWSDLLARVEAVRGVRKVGDGDSDFLLNGLSDDVPLGVKAFPVLGAVTLTNGDSGLPL